MQGARLLLNISKCDGKIQEACNISLSNDTSSGFDACSAIMMDFRWDFSLEMDFDFLMSIT